VELSFLATRSGLARVTLGGSAGAPSAGLARQTGGDVVLDNGVVRVALNASPEKPPIEVALRTKPFGVLVPEAVLEDDRPHRPLPDERRTATILRNGPFRAQAEVTGRLGDAAGRPSLSYRLTVEVWTGRPAFRVDWMLMHLLTGRRVLEVRRATLCGEWKVGTAPVRRFVQRNHGPYYKRRVVKNPARVAIAADFSSGSVCVTDRAMLLDEIEYLPYLEPGTNLTDEWLCLAGDAGAVYATVHDFKATRPNVIESAGSRLDYHFIPEGHATSWPQGRRREQTLFFVLGAKDAEEESLEKEAAAQFKALWTLGRALPAGATLRGLGCYDMPNVLPSQRGRNIRFAMLLDHLCGLKTPGDKWNLGDTADSGYTRTYAALPHSFMPLPGMTGLRPQFTSEGHTLYPDAAGDWVEPVWTNNEYDIIHALAIEVMRTGRARHAPMLRWTARHHIEVDFVAFSDDPIHHRAVPFHSHFHNTKGAIPSHFFTQGLLEYYALTGDRDALEAALALGDKIIRLLHSDDAFTWKFAREIGWGLRALVCLVEAGFDQYRAECDHAADFIMAYDRAAFTGAVNLSAGREGRPLVRQMIDNAFGYVSIVEAMDRHQKVSGRADIAAWLRTLLMELKEASWDAIREAETPTPFHMVPHIMAIGYERTGDRDFLRVGMVVLEAFFATQALEGGNPYRSLREAKPSAMLYRALHRFLAHADRLDLLRAFEFPSLPVIPGEEKS